jgi:hypothetical protein
MIAKQEITGGRLQPQERVRLALLIGFHIILCCVTLVMIAGYEYVPDLNSPTRYTFYPPAFHIFYDPAWLCIAVAVVAAFALVSSFFAVARFSFGYFAGFYFYTMIVGYLWINCFSDLNYDHRLGGLSAAVSLVAFLLPALFISSRLRQDFVLSTRAFDRLLMLIFLLSVAVIAVGAAYNFRLVGLADIYRFRDQIAAPAIVNYFVAIASTALLPFVFAAFIVRGAHWRAAAVLLLLVLFYPVTLSKVAFFTPIWLVVVLLLSRIFEARTAAILSLLGPVLTGLLLFLAVKAKAASVFYTINFRLFAIPSVAMDVYNEFFARHDLTYFCQISVLKLVMNCPYHEPLSVLLERAYGLGNFNASLFATEGIASAGPLFAPVAAFACGLVVALGNRLSAGLPDSFILVSGAIFPQIMLNVPLSTVLLTHGGAIMFLLWYLTPRAIFEQDGRANAAAG